MPEAMQRQRVLMAWVVWFAITASIVIYYVVAHVVIQGAAPHPPANPTLKMAFAALSCAMAVASFAVARRFLPRSDELPSLAKPRQPLPFKRWFAIFTLRLALHEGIAISGLMLAFLNASAREMLPFGAAAIALNLFALPRNPPKEE